LFESAKKSKATLKEMEEELIELRGEVQELQGTTTSDDLLNSNEKKLSRITQDYQAALKSHEQEKKDHLARIEQLRREAEEKDKMVEELRVALEDVNSKYDEAQIVALMTAKRASEEGDQEVLQRTTFSRINEFLDLERVNRLLTSENEQLRGLKKDNFVLEEKLREAEIKLSGLRKIEQRLFALEAENQGLKEGGSTAGSDALDFKSLIEQTAELTNLKDKLGQTKGQLRAKTSELDEVRQEMERMRSELSEMRSKFSEKDDEILKLLSELKLAKLELANLTDQAKSQIVIN